MIVMVPKDEILVNQLELDAAIMEMRSLLKGTSYGRHGLEKFLVSTSETCDAAEQMYQTLRDTETVLVELVEKTIRAMEAAGVSFEEADIRAGTGFREIPYGRIV